MEFLKSFNRTRHCGDRAALDVVTHPADNDPAGDVASYNRVAVGMPGMWCPWTCCDEGCCLRWDQGEKPYTPERWLRYLIDTFLRPGAALAADPAARARGLTFDHVLAGMIVGERRETCELFALAVKDNVVRRRTLVPPREAVDEWGYRSQEDERKQRKPTWPSAGSASTPRSSRTCDEPADDCVDRPDSPREDAIRLPDAIYHPSRTGGAAARAYAQCPPGRGTGGLDIRRRGGRE